VTQRSLVAVEETASVADFYEDTQPEFGGVAIVNKPQKYLSPQSINTDPWMAGMKSHYFECIQQIKESEASVDRRDGLDEVQAHLAIGWSCTNKLFGTPEIQLPSESGDATNTRGNALDTLTTDYLKEDP
jgi:hypothetical protein